MPYALSRFVTRLPGWVRRLPFYIFALIAVLLAVALLAVVAGGAEDFQLLGPPWEWVSLCVFGLLNLAAGVLGNLAYDRFHRWESERLPAVGEFFQNHDLARLVGQAIGMTLRAAAADLNPKDAALVKKLARRAEGDWPAIAASESARGLLGPLGDGQLAAFVRDPTRPALTAAQADGLLALLHPEDLEEPPAFTDPASAVRVRDALIGRFGEALRQAAKLDFGRRGAGFAALWLDLAGALLTEASAAAPDDADKAQALAEVRITLTTTTLVPAADAAGLRAGLDALAGRLDGIHRAVRAEGRASGRRHGLTHRALAGIAVLICLVGAGVWYWQQRTHHTVEQGQAATDERLAAIEAQLREALAPKQAGEDPTQRQLPPELLDKARELLARGDREQQAVAKIALGQHDAADRLIQDLKREPLAEAFRLLTLEGDNWYNAGAFDRALGPYEQALALRPEDPTALNKAAIAHNGARLGDIAGHQHRAIELLTLAQRTWTREAEPWAWAATQNNLGNAWLEMPTGERAANLQRAIEAYTAALTVHTREAHPVDWATAHNNLGIVWTVMPTGERAVNLQRAIDAYTAALTVRTREAHPVEWASTQNNLGTAWADLPTGDRAANLQRAIDAYTAALEVRTPEAHQVDWAQTQNNLGTAWLFMPTGERAANLQRAIDAYTAALTVYTREAHPVGWAMTQNNLGIAWESMPTGDRAANQQRAIDAYTAALTVRSREAHPVDWAMTQNNIGRAWAEMLTGERAANLQRAIDAYTAAQSVYTREAHPVDWAMTQDNLGNAWLLMPTGERAANLQRAIDAPTAVLTVYTREAHPVEWATTQNNLGTAWQKMPRGDRAENLLRAIDAFNNALAVVQRDSQPALRQLIETNLQDAMADQRATTLAAELVETIARAEQSLSRFTQEASPVEWAQAQTALATALVAMRTGDRRAQVRRAINAYEAALDVYRRDNHPFEWAATRFNLAKAYGELTGIDGDWRNVGGEVAQVRAAGLVWTPEDYPVEYGTFIAPAIIQLRNVWDIAGLDMGAFDAIQPAD